MPGSGCSSDADGGCEDRFKDGSGEVHQHLHRKLKFLSETADVLLPLKLIVVWIYSKSSCPSIELFTYWIRLQTDCTVTLKDKLCFLCGIQAVVQPQ